MVAGQTNKFWRRLSMLIDIDAEVVDALTLESLRVAIECTEQSIEQLESQGDSLKRYQLEDLAYSRDILPALEKVYEYFGGSLE